MSSSAPLVSVITPIYNEEKYLAECIESVLSQEYRNFEYLLVDNKSSDGSLEIARHYEQQDRRIRVIENAEFLPQIDNFNHALRQISSESVYTKVVQGDDWIYPDCLSKLVARAEEDPDIAVVSSYVVLGWHDRASVYLYGLPVSKTVMDGREACRRFLIDGLYLFGNSTVHLLRSDLVRRRHDFFDANSVIEDVDVFFEILGDSRFGFVHQVLAFNRRDNVSTISALASFDLMLLTRMLAVHKYGSEYLAADEQKAVTKRTQSAYYDALGMAMLKRVPAAYWQFHRKGLTSVGLAISRYKLLLGLTRVLLDLVLNPKNTFEAIWRRLHRSR